MQRITLTGLLLLSAAFAPIHTEAQVYRADLYTQAGDACQRINAALHDAVANRSGIVDATYITGIQTCSVDPFSGFPSLANPAPSGASAFPLNVLVRLGATTFQTTVPWTITNSGFQVEGSGRLVTAVQYVGTGATSAVLTVQPVGHAELQAVAVRDLAILGSAQSTDGLVVMNAHRSEFSNISTWGMSGCGIHTLGAVADTFFRPHTSSHEQDAMNWPGVTPTSGLCFDKAGAIQTTAGTVTDAITEGVNGTGWRLISAAQMVFTAGTSEGNKGGPVGVQVDTGSDYNSFIDSDFEDPEGSSIQEVQDNGNSTSWRNIITATGDAHGMFIVGPSSFWTVVENGNMNYIDGRLPDHWIHGGDMRMRKIIQPACGVPGGAFCTNQVSWAADGAFPDTNYYASCSLGTTVGKAHVGSMYGETTTGFGVYLIADDSIGAGGGTLKCLVYY